MCNYVYRYKECITDQSNWSGPFSLVVVCLLHNLGIVSLIPGRVLDEIFFTDFSPPTTLPLQCFTNTKNIIKLLLDSSQFSSLIQNKTLRNITKAITELCYIAAYGKIEKSEGC